MNEEQLKIVLTAVNKTKPVFTKMKSDMRGVSSSVQSVQKKTAIAARKIKNSFKSMGTQAKLMLAAVGFVAFRVAKGMVDAASDMEETQSKFNVIFGDIQDEANKWAEDFGRAMGRSEESMKAVTATTGDMLKPLGFLTQEAFDLSRAMTTLALDVASFTNRQDADVIRAFQRAITGERESLKTLGIVINEADIKQEAFRLGLFNGTGEVHKQAKAIATINLLYANTVDAQGDLARTSMSFANQTKALTAKMQDFSAEMGGKIIPSLLVFADVVMPTVNSIMDSFSQRTSGATKKTSSFAKIIVVLAETFRTGFAFIKHVVRVVGRGLSTFIARTIDGMGTLGKVIKAVFSGNFEEAGRAMKVFRETGKTHAEAMKKEQTAEWFELVNNIDESAKRITDAYDEQLQEQNKIARSNELQDFAKKDAEENKRNIEALIESYKGAFDNMGKGAKEAAEKTQKALEKVGGAIQKIRDSFDDLKKDLRDLGTKTAEGLAEAVVQQEEKIAELRKDIKGEDDGERLKELQKQLKAEEKALGEFSVIAIGLEKQIAEERRRNALTDFEKRVEDLENQKQEEIKQLNEKAKALEEQLNKQLESAKELQGSDEDTADSSKDMVDSVAKGYHTLEGKVEGSVDFLIKKNKELMAELAKFRALTAPTEGPDRRTFQDIVSQAGVPDPAAGGIFTPQDPDFNPQYPNRAISRIQDNVRDKGGGSTLTVNLNNPVIDTPEREKTLVDRLKLVLGRDFAKSNLSSS